MGFISRLMGRSPASAQRSRLASQPPSQHSRFPSQLSQPPSQQLLGGGASHNGMRKELLRVVLRDILNRNGIPKDWISATSWCAAASTQVGHPSAPGDPPLGSAASVHGVAFQAKDPATGGDAGSHRCGLAAQHLWLFALDDVSDCPALPHPGDWTSDRTRHHAGSSRKLPAGVRADSTCC